MIESPVNNAMSSAVKSSASVLQSYHISMHHQVISIVKSKLIKSMFRNFSFLYQFVFTVKITASGVTTLLRDKMHRPILLLLSLSLLLLLLLLLIFTQ